MKNNKKRLKDLIVKLSVLFIASIAIMLVVLNFQKPDLILAGFLQGALEWLPISSEGVITLLLNFLGYSFQDGIDISLFLHLGTLIAILSFFYKEIISSINLINKKLLFFIVLSGLTTSLIGLPLYLIIQGLTFNGRAGQMLIGSALLITGFLQLKRKDRGDREMNDVKNKDGLMTGLVQGLSVFPGISRSGITTLILSLRGFNLQNSLRLSFLSGIIPIFAAQLLTGIKGGFFFKKEYLIAALISFIVGRITIGYLLKIAERINFGIFCLVFGLFNIFLGFLF